jgi:diguanylate cyclase (GGDEF)-like protein
MIKHVVNSPLTDISNAKILLVDDDRLNTAILRKSLDQFNNVYSVHSGEEAIEFCQKTLPDLVLLDVMMPGLDGHVTCKILKTLEGMKDCPIIFSTSLTGIEEELKCWEAGGSDFVSKPVSSITLLIRLQSHIRLKMQGNKRTSSPIFDSLTGLRNKRFFEGFYQQHIHVSKRNNTDLSLVIVDIDYFEQYIDLYGHAQGDLCLKLLTRTVSEILKHPTDVAIRYSEKKFVIVLPNTDITGTKFIAKEIISHFEKLAIPHVQSPHAVVTVSVGLASLSTTSDEEDIFTLANQRLYSIKNSGKNACA